MLSHTSCNSLFVIYIIKCNACNSYYIGQTESLNRRLNTHIRSCSLNLCSLSTQCTGVVKHFNSNNVCAMNQFSFSVFHANIVNKFERLNVETQLIHLLIDLDIKILNDLVPDRYYWNRNVKLFEVND